MWFSTHSGPGFYHTANMDVKEQIDVGPWQETESGINHITEEPVGFA